MIISVLEVSNYDRRLSVFRFPHFFLLLSFNRMTNAHTHTDTTTHKYKNIPSKNTLLLWNSIKIDSKKRKDEIEKKS